MGFWPRAIFKGGGWTSGYERLRTRIIHPVLWKEMMKMSILMIVCLILACVGGVVVSIINCCRSVKREYNKWQKEKANKNKSKTKG